MESEEIAAELVNEKIVGFDMEWPYPEDTNPNAALQRRVSLIQIACEDRIALFHIGLHAGSTPNDLLAPSLRRIIESPDISKCGVSVLSADFWRLRQWFRLKPQGAFELSYFHNLVAHGAANPAKCDTVPRKLAEQVEEHLGLPLDKGEVRVSNWSRPLTRQQVEYAAADAYAGFMLYHCLNAKRVAMRPSPPLPAHAETYRPMIPGVGSKVSIQLRPVDGKGTVMTALEFFRPDKAFKIEAGRLPLGEDVDFEGRGRGGGELEGCRNEGQETDRLPLTSSFEESLGFVRVGQRGRHIILAKAESLGSNVCQKPVVQEDIVQQDNLSPRSDPVSTDLRECDRSEETILASASGTVDMAEPKPNAAIFNEGRAEILFQRLREHRRSLARERKCAPFIIAHDTLLHAISRQWPRNDTELLRIRGIGKRKMDDFGQAWLNIVNHCIDELDTEESLATIRQDAASKHQA